MVKEIDSCKARQKTRAKLNVHYELAQQFFPNPKYEVSRTDHYVNVYFISESSGIMPEAVEISNFVSSEVKVKHWRALDDARGYTQQLEKRLNQGLIALFRSSRKEVILRTPNFPQPVELS